MRIIGLIFFLLISVIAYGQQLTSLGASQSTNITIISKSELLRARKFFPVMKTPDGSIVNEGGIMGDAVTVQAIKTIAEGSGELSDAAHEAMTNALGYVQEATKTMPRNSVGLAIAFSPDTDFTNLTLYVAHESTDGTNDTLWIWMNQDIRLNLRVFFKYSYYGGESVQPVTWTPGYTNLFTVTDNRGRQWEGCHCGVVKRPDWAINKCCITEPNIPIGGPNGFNLGGITIIDAEDDEPFYTGEITNTIDHIVLRCEDGVIKECFSYTPEEQTP